MILYIHGFRTTHNSYKANLLKSQYSQKIISSDHSHIPNKAINDLEKIIEEKNVSGIIASSIGGYYATYLSDKYNLKTVLINPSVMPYETTRKYLGDNERQDGVPFIWKEAHLKELEQFKVENIKKDNFFIFLQKGDVVLDYRIALNRYNGSKMVVEDGGNHRFKGFERFFDEVSTFLNINHLESPKCFCAYKDSLSY